MVRSRISFFAGMVLLASGAAVGRMMPPPRARADVEGSCPRSLLLNFEVNRDGETVREVPVWRMASGSAFFFDGGAAIDADGAPNAYNPEDSGLDELTNAGHPGHWDGVVQNEQGDPYVQGPGDPFPGYYVSCTSLFDRTKERTDPARYVDASKIPYVVLPGEVARQTGARLGDFAVVFNLRNGKSSYAIFADVGTMGEGSVALARNLGIWSDARQGVPGRECISQYFPGQATDSQGRSKRSTASQKNKRRL